MKVEDNDQRFYWRRHTNGDGQWNTRSGRREPEGPPGADLAALRHGIGRPPGTVPAMWRFYTQTDPEGRVTPRFEAEHAALTLYAVHQQAQARPMHRKGIGLGSAVLALRRQGDKADPDNEENVRVDWAKLHPVDRRFYAAATASSLTELVWHLRGLVTQLRGIHQPLDYTQLFNNLSRWQSPDSAAKVRREWGLQYFTYSKSALFASDADEPSPTPDSAKEQQ